MTIQTDVGELKAEKTTDPFYPGITISLDGEVVALVEKKPGDKSVRTVLYNKHEDDYDNIHDFDNSES